jgi:DeoR family glycerol-3-phosphate regulon repressor
MDSTANQRQREIVMALRRAGGSLRIQSLAQELQVTEETVRRNLKTLAERGVVEKVHGGASLLGQEEDDDFKQRLRHFTDAKKKIAKCAASMIGNGSSLFLDIGSTTSFIADALRDHENLLVVTNSVSVAYKLATRNSNRVFMAGGGLRSQDGGVFSGQAMDFANNFKTDFAVLSAAGINSENGFMLFDLEEAEYSRVITSNAKTRIIAADSSKFGRSAPITACDPSLIDVLITELSPPKNIAAAARGWGTKIILAE